MNKIKQQIANKVRDIAGTTDEAFLISIRQAVTQLAINPDIDKHLLGVGATMKSSVAFAREHLTEDVDDLRYFLWMRMSDLCKVIAESGELFAGPVIIGKVFTTVTDELKNDFIGLPGPKRNDVGDNSNLKYIH